MFEVLRLFHLTSSQEDGLSQDLKRRTLVVRIFPNAASCIRLIRALAAEEHEDWREDHRYLNMEALNEHMKVPLLKAA